MDTEVLMQHRAARSRHIDQDRKQHDGHEPADEIFQFRIAARRDDASHVVGPQDPRDVGGHHAEDYKQHRDHQHADPASAAEHAEKLPDFSSGRKTGSHDRADKHESHIQ